VVSWGARAGGLEKKPIGSKNTFRKNGKKGDMTLKNSYQPKKKKGGGKQGVTSQIPLTGTQKGKPEHKVQRLKINYQPQEGGKVGEICRGSGGNLHVLDRERKGEGVSSSVVEGEKKDWLSAKKLERKFQKGRKKGEKKSIK